MGIHTPEQLRAHYEQFPDDYKFAVDDDLLVRLAYPSGIIDWAGFAFISHVPSMSSITLGTPFGIAMPDGTVTSASSSNEETILGREVYVRRHYESAEGEARLEAVLADEAIMQRILSWTSDFDGPLPTFATTGSAHDGALLSGRLSAGGSCLYLFDEEFQQRWLPVFAEGSASWEDGWLVLGDQRYAVGARVTVGGGETKDIGNLDLVQAPHESCATERVWRAWPLP